MHALYGLLADAVVLVHVAFVVFAALGGWLVLVRPRIAWIHIPAFTWAFLIAIFQWICPLTPLESHLRGLAGEAGLGDEGFIEHYVLPLLYPDDLTIEIGIVLAGTLVVLNVISYSVAARKHHSRRRRQRP